MKQNLWFTESSRPDWIPENIRFKEFLATRQLKDGSLELVSGFVLFDVPKRTKITCPNAIRRVRADDAIVFVTGQTKI